MYEFVSLEELELQTNIERKKMQGERKEKKTVLADVFTAK